MVWALSRRTTRRHFILNPDEARQMEQAYWYCLGHAAQLHGVAVRAGCLMSTHSHEVVTDVRGELSLFVQTFHRHLALCAKAIRGWPGEVFDKRSTGAHGGGETHVNRARSRMRAPTQGGQMRPQRARSSLHGAPTSRQPR
jgi:hypothetical protein